MALNFNTQTALVTVYAWGAGGAGGTRGGWTYGSRGGAGGFASGKMIVKAGELYQIVVGGGGIVNMGGYLANGYLSFVEGGGAGNVGTNNSDNRYAGSGGGYSGVFLNVANTQTTALIIAGGGGGGGASNGAGTYNVGGAGGGLCGQKGLGPYDWTTYFGSGGGNGGTQSAGGAQTTGMTYQGGAGSALFGGRSVTGPYGGGGGGGWFGGGSGGYVEANTMGGGGGGSGYVNSSTIFCAVLITGCYATPACSTNAYRGLAGNGGRVAQGGEFGRIVIAYPGAQQAHGGTVSTSSGTTIHTFDRSGVFALYGTPTYGSTATQVEMLIVGGGGAGGANMGGGGGGGAVVSVYSTLTVGSYLVTVGQGGRGFCGTCAQRGGQGGHSGVVRNYQNSYSYHFDGIADYIYTTSTVSPIQQYSILGSSNAFLDQNFTFEGYYWFMDGSTQRSNVMMMNYNAGAFGSGSIYYGKHSLYDGKVTFWAGNYSPNWPMLIDPVHPPTGRWVHYAVSRNGTNFTLFRDGVAVAANTTVTNITPPMVASLFLGNNGSNFSTNFRGYMSNVRLTTGNSVYTSGVNTATTSTLYYSGVFNGITDYLSTASTTLLTVGANPFTLEGWINLPRLPQTIGDNGRYVIAQKGGTVTSNFEWQFGVHQSTSTTSTYNLVLLQSTGGTAATLSTATSTIIPITSGTWNHVALSVTGGTTSFWFNGQPVGTATAPTFYSGTGPLFIGASSVGSNQLLGYISNLRLLNGTALYSGAFTPSTTPLTSVTNTVLLTLQNSTIVDNAQTASSFISYGTPGVWTNSPFSTATQVFTVPTDQLGRVQSSSTNLLGTSINAIMDRTQNPAGSLVFNGSTDYIAFPPNSIYSPAGPFTIEAYVYLQAAAYGTAYYIASNWNNGTATACSWKVGVSTTGFITFSYGIGASNVTITGTTQRVPLSRWAHVAVVRDTSNNVTLYVNGIADATVTAVSGTLNLNTTIPVKIGSDDAVTTHVILTPWFGLISGFRFVAGEAVWTTNFTPPQRLPGLSTTSTNTVLLLNFPYNITGSDTDVYLRSFSDSSNYRRQPTITGTPYPMHWSPYINTGSVSLLTAQSPLVPVDYSYFGNNIIRGATNNNVTATTFSPFYPELTVTPTVPITTGLNYSAYFDGYNNYSNILVTATNFVTQNLTLPLDFTIECWINTSGALDNNTYILNKGGGSLIAYASYGISIGWPNVYFMASVNNSNYTIGGDAPTQSGRIGAIKPNTWHHIAVTRQGGTFRGFVDGVQGMTSSTTATSTLFDTGVRGLAIGSNYGTNWGVPANMAGPYSGYMSNLRIIRGQALYTGDFTPPTQALTTSTVGTAGANVTATITGTVLLLALQSPSIADNSGFGYTLGVTGQVFPQTYNPFSSVTSLGPTSALAMGGGGGASNYSVKTFGASMGANGGGASGNSSLGAGGAGAPGVMGLYGGGFAGAASTGSGLYWMGGGGGAGGPGFSGGIVTTGAQGGVGVPSTILGNTYYFGGGGGGSGYTKAAGCGGRGGGGGGAPKSTSSGGYGDRSSIFRAQDGGYGTLVAVTNQPGGFAAPNSGGGGGGASHQTTFGGAGGSGIVVIKYPGPQRAMGGVVTTVGTSTVHTFYKTDVFTMLGNMTYPMALGGRGGNGYAGGGQGANSFGAYGGPGAPGGALNTASNVYFGGAGAGGGSWCTYFAGGGGGTGVCGLVNQYTPGGAPNQSGQAGNGGSTSTQFGNGGLFGAGGGGSATFYYNVCWGNGGSGAVLITYNTTGTTATTYAFPNPTPPAYSYLNRITYPYGSGAGVSTSTFLTFSTITDRTASYEFGAVINNGPAKTYTIFGTGRTTPFVGACVPVSKYPQASCIYAGNTQVTTYVTAHCMMIKNNDTAQPVNAGGASVGNPGNYQVIQEVTKANDPRLITARVQNFIVGVTGVGCGTSTGVVTSVNQFWTS